MRTIIVKLPPAADLSSEMAEMRGWLDNHGCAPTRFDYDLERRSTIIRIRFSEEDEAELFKRHFGGNESQFVNSERPRLLETMERACWWRLMAEEIRTEADGFASLSAKETLTNVALTYDRMAENLEKRLGSRRTQAFFSGTGSGLK
jgi:hypothetical protein